MKYLSIELGDGGRAVAYLFNSEEPDWHRTLLLIRDELMREWSREGETMNVNMKIRFLSDIEGRYVRRDKKLLEVMCNGE